MNMIKKLTAAAVLASAFVLPAQAETILDTFDYYTGPGAALGAPVSVVPSFNIEVDNGTLTNSINPGFSFAGANVFYNLTLTDNASGLGSRKANLNNDGGVLAYNNDSGVKSESLIDYVGPATGTDFSVFGSHLFFDLISSDAGFDLEIVIKDINGNSVAGTISVLSDILVPTRVLLSFASFVGDLAFDLTLVKSIHASISSSAPAIDLEIDTVGVVPEPATLGLLGLGLMGLGLRRRRAA